MTHSKSPLHLNDALLLLSVVKEGSFLRAAAVLGCDQATVSRRVAALERRAGHPLFYRRTTGAVSTAAAQPLIDAAAAVASACSHFERLLAAGGNHTSPVSVSCPEGLASYVIAPCLNPSPQAFPLGLEVCRPLPRLNLLPIGMPADINILLVGPGKSVPANSDFHVKKIGKIKFSPIAGKEYLTSRGCPENISDFRQYDILQHSVYDVNDAFSVWTEIAYSGFGPIMTMPTSSGLHRAALSGGGITLLPNFAPLLDSKISLVPVAMPAIPVDIWLAAHPDTLRLKSVRAAYDSISALIGSSPWLRAD